eukprot:scaffold247869_cov40-Tisochrysis_lutea.AAC.1
MCAQPAPAVSGRPRAFARLPTLCGRFSAPLWRPASRSGAAGRALVARTITPVDASVRRYNEGAEAQRRGSEDVCGVEPIALEGGAG